MGQDQGQDDPDRAREPAEAATPADEELEVAPTEPLEQAKVPAPAEAQAEPSAEERPHGQEAWRGARMDDQEARNWAVGAHLLGLTWLLSVPGLIGPLIVWLVKGKEHPLVEGHAKEAVNFQLSILIYGLVSAVLMLLLIGFVLILIVLLMGLILPIVAAVKTSDGEDYRYPLTMRLIN